MGKYVAKNMTVTLDAVALTCLQSVEMSEDVDTYTVECAGDSNKQTITGLQNTSVTINMLIDTDDIAKLAATSPSTTGAFVFLPNGTSIGDITVTSTNATVTSRSLSHTVTGLSAMTLELMLDDVTVGEQA